MLPGVNPYLFVLLGCLLGAGGQVLLKLGAAGAVQPLDYLNGRLALGFLLYGAGAIFWVVALSRLPLSRVYPFTILTFVLVYFCSVILLGERMTTQVLFGAAFV